MKVVSIFTFGVPGAQLATAARSDLAGGCSLIVF